MKNIVVFAGSNSKTSINKQLAVYAASLVEDVETTVLDLNDFELPLYGIDYENEHGIPENAHKFIGLLKNTDGIILSLAEHNGAYSTAFKNLFDWMSRIDGKLFFKKPMLLMATSPGGRGGLSVLDIAKGRFPFHDANIIESFSLPFFGEHFKEGQIVDDVLNTQLQSAATKFQNSL